MGWACSKNALQATAAQNAVLLGTFQATSRCAANNVRQNATEGTEEGWNRVSRLGANCQQPSTMERTLYELFGLIYFIHSLLYLLYLLCAVIHHWWTSPYAKGKVYITLHYYTLMNLKLSI